MNIIDKCLCGVIGEEGIDKIKYTQYLFTEQEDSMMN